MNGEPQPPPAGPAFWIGAAIGGALIAFGIGGMLATQEAHRVASWALWLGGMIVLHDLLLAPIAIVAGWLLARRARPLAGPVIAGALVVSATVAVATAPVWLERGRNRSPDNSTILPDDSYPTNLVLVVAAIWIAALAIVVIRARMRRVPRA